jgi:hypothetical protein
MMADYDGSTDEEAGNGRRKWRQMREEDQMSLFHAVRSTMVGGRLQRGIFTKLAKSLGFELRTIRRQWH